MKSEQNTRQRIVEITQKEINENSQWMIESYYNARHGGIVQCRECWKWFNLYELYRCFHCCSYFCTYCSYSHFGPHLRYKIIKE